MYIPNLSYLNIIISQSRNNNIKGLNYIYICVFMFNMENSHIKSSVGLRSVSSCDKFGFLPKLSLL